MTTEYRINSGKEYSETFITIPLLITVLSPFLQQGWEQKEHNGNSPANGHFLKLRSEKKLSLRKNYSCQQNQREEGVRLREKRYAVCKVPQGV